MKNNNAYSFFLILFFFAVFKITAQNVYDREVNAIIKVDKTSEFVTFTATTENLTLSDFSLRYEFMLFKKDKNNNVSKSQQANRFFLKASEKKILSSTTVNNAIEGKVTLLLLVFPISDDEEQGAISKHRIVVTNVDGKIVVEEDDLKKKQPQKVSQDQDTSAKDGLFLNGLIIQKTLTKSGRDFYRYFYQDYYIKDIVTTKNILIQEVPGQRRSTRISVKVDNQLVWQFFARPKKDYLKKMATTALNRCIRYLQQLEKQKQTIKRY